MVDLGKKNILGVGIDAVDYQAARTRILEAALQRRPYGVSALAVHGVMTGFTDRHQRHRLNALELVTPDGQPVRWALNVLHRTALSDRVYGPILMSGVCEDAARHDLPIYLYGSSGAVLRRLENELKTTYPRLVIAGRQSSRFRRTSAEEKTQIVKNVVDSGARLTLVCLGCPRQEVFAYEYRKALCMPTIAVGAAFDYHAGLLQEPAARIQRMGLQWAYRLLQEPKRLWRRYLVLNPAYLMLLAIQATGLWRPAMEGTPPDEELRFG